MNNYNKIIEDRIFLYLDSIKNSILYDEIYYSLTAPGKRLRPKLLLASYCLFKQDFDKVLDFALAIELIHNYSLIHDDLPSMDNDEYRRGRKTLHIVFGEAEAILTGDSLLSESFNIISNNILLEDNPINISNKIKVLSIFSKLSGLNGMIKGQIIDINNKFTTKQEILEMYERKCSDLFRASICSGAILGGANENELEYLDNFAKEFGIFFQIRDDIKDYKNDSDSGKITILTFLKDKEGMKLYNDKLNNLNNIIKELEKSLDMTYFKNLINNLI